MTLYDYEFMTEEEKIQWLDSFQMFSGLRYFGGKSRIVKNLANHIFNMALRICQDGHEKSIFIDAFTGGGKVALSMPVGWFDVIVMNDLNYGVYNYFVYCRNNPEALIQMIELLGSVMSETFFKFCAFCRSNDGSTTRKKKAEASLRQAGQIRKNKGELSEKEKEKLKEAEKIEKVIDFMDDKEIEPLVSAAMTYWVTQCSYNGATEPEDISYGLAIQDNNGEIPTRAGEKREIERIIKHAKKLIPLIHDRMIKLKIIVERMDYKDLIKKYNGKVVSSDPEEAELYEQITKYPKLWYFDPPYHPATLSGGNKAPYEDSFDSNEVKEMVEILHGDHEEDYGKIEYFIKSDYDPKYTYEQFKEQLEEAKQKLAYEVKKSGKKEKIKKYKEFIARMTKQVGESWKYRKDFDILEENIEWDKHKANTKNPVFYKECLGDFDKGATDSERGEKLKGREYIWCRGNYIPED